MLDVKDKYFSETKDSSIFEGVENSFIVAENLNTKVYWINSTREAVIIY